MCPSILFGKAGQKASGCDGTCWPPTDVTHIGKIRIELLLIFIPQWQLPGTISRRLAGVQQFLNNFVVITDHRTSYMPKCNNAGTGQGGHIDNDGWLEFLHVAQGVTQDQSPFGIRIQDFHALP